MRKTILSLVFLLVLAACQCETQILNTSSASYDTSYKPAIFTDSLRLQKIKKALPVIDSLYKHHAINNHFPGMAYGIVVDGQLIHTGAYGYTDIKKKIPVTAASLFRIASMSKSITAMAILKLRDEGKLSLDDPADKYIPELQLQQYPTADAPRITIRHLLTHSAGFPEDNPWGDRQLADTDQEFMEFLRKRISFSNPPGIAYEYSNLGFALLGKIITNVSGIRYQDYIRENIWQPLGMQHTEYEYSNVAPEKLAHGYRWLNETWNEEELLHDMPDGSWGAMGSMICSVEEFARYMALHLNAWPPNNTADTAPVKRSSVREMHQPWRFSGFNPEYRYPNGRKCAAAFAYGYGLRWMQDCDQRVYISHSGGLPGFGSQWQILPDYGIGIVAFANRTYAPFGNINLVALDTLIKLANLQPRQLPAADILEKRKQELVNLLPHWENATASGLFAENFFADNPIDSLKKYTREAFTKAGNIVSISPMRAENQLRGSFMLNGEHSDIEIYFTLSPENPPLIQAFGIWERPKR